MSYPGVNPSDVEADMPQTNPGVQVAQTVPPARPQYGGASWADPREFDFETPSGALCRIRKVRQEDALAMGLINHLDIFSAKLLKDAQGNPRAADDANDAVMEKLAESGKTTSFFETIKKVVLRAVIAPTLVEADPSQVPPGSYSIESVGTRDRMAIFFAAIGEDMQKIDRFRGE